MFTRSSDILVEDKREHESYFRNLGEDLQRKVNFGSLFSGIGGLDLGLTRAGMQCLWQVENDPYCVRVLEKHWPRVPRHGDIREFDPPDFIPLICGGFPCQNLSHANVKTREGLSGEKSGLWREFVRVIRRAKPRLVIVENISTGWLRWVPTVRYDLAKLGYSSMPIRVSACDVGAYHERKRVFVIAHSYGHGQPAIAFHEKMAQLCEATELSWTDWGHPSSQALGMVDGVPRRMDRLRGVGNAVVPQVAEQVGRLIIEASR